MIHATSCVFRCTLISSDNSLIELDEGLVGCSLKRMEEVDGETGFVTSSLRSCRRSTRSNLAVKYLARWIEIYVHGCHVGNLYAKLTSSY